MSSTIISTLCENCGHRTLPITNEKIDAAILSQRNRTAWWVPLKNDAARIRSRIYYSATIHGVEVTTTYQNGYLTLETA